MHKSSNTKKDSTMLIFYIYSVDDIYLVRVDSAANYDVLLPLDFYF